MNKQLPRTDMTATLTAQPRPVMDGLRRVARDDAPLLATLLFEAYRGTVDEQEANVAEALVEVEKALRGDYGRFLPQCSWVVERDGALASATLVTRFRERPFVAFAMTHPAWQRRGLGRACLLHTMQDALDGGDAKLSLIVTLANTRAVALYEQLGFVPGF